MASLELPSEKEEAELKPWSGFSEMVSRVEGGEGRVRNGPAFFMYIITSNLRFALSPWIKDLVTLSSGDLTKTLPFISAMHQIHYSNKRGEPW